MPRKSRAQLQIELRMKSLGEDRSRLIEKRAKAYEAADQISLEIRGIEDRISDLQSLLKEEPEIIDTKEPERENEQDR